MAQQIINIGTTANDGTGDKLRDGLSKINDNFTEIYNNTNAGTNISISGNTFTTLNTNGNIIFDPAGTGTIEVIGTQNITGALTIDQLSFDGNNISTNVTNADIEFTPTGTGNVVIRNGDLDLNLNNIINGTAITSVSFVGALTGNATTATTATSAVTAGTVTTAAQPAITSIGTLTALTMSGNIVMGTNDITGLGNITGTGAASFNTLSGTLSTAAQTNITSLGTLTTLTVDQISINGNAISSTLTNANIVLAPSGTGIVEMQSGASITGGLTVTGSIGGTLTTATQPNITSVGTLTSLSVSGALNSTLSTAAQPNITSVGTLTSLTTSGNITGSQLAIQGNQIVSLNTNADIQILPAGTGQVQLDTEIAIEGNTIKTINTNSDLQLDPAGTGTIDLILAASGAGTPGNFSANEYIAIKIGGVTKYIPLATATW